MASAAATQPYAWLIPRSRFLQVHCVTGARRVEPRLTAKQGLGIQPLPGLHHRRGDLTSTPADRGSARLECRVCRSDPTPQCAVGQLGPAARPDAALPMGNTVVWSTAEDLDKLLHGARRSIEGCLLVGRQLDLEDALHATCTKNDRDPDEQVVGPELALEQDRAGQDALAVEEDGLDHLEH